MSILVSLQHTTSYRYDRPVVLGPQIVRLRPAPHCRTHVPTYSLKVTPAEHFVNWQQDPMGNWLARYVFPERTSEFSVSVDLLADMSVINPFDFFIEPAATEYPFVYDGEFSEELAPYLNMEQAGPRLAAYLASITRGKQNIVDFLVALNQTPARRCALCRAHGAGRAVDGGHARARLRLLPRQRLAAGADPASSRARGALRLRLSHPVEARREGARRPVRRGGGLHRPARLGRGLSAGRRLDRARSDFRPAHRRRPSAAGGDAALPRRRADLRRRRSRQGRVRIFDEAHARRREAARDISVFG